MSAKNGLLERYADKIAGVIGCYDRVVIAGTLTAIAHPEAMSGVIIMAPLGLWTLGIVFVLGGIYVAIEETLEASFCAELVPENQHGMAFGVLATVNGIGDLVSSIVVGTLWSAIGTSVAFGYSAVLALAGALLVFRLKPHDPRHVR